MASTPSRPIRPFGSRATSATLPASGLVFRWTTTSTSLPTNRPRISRKKSGWRWHNGNASHGIDLSSSAPCCPVPRALPVRRSHSSSSSLFAFSPIWNAALPLVGRSSNSSVEPMPRRDSWQIKSLSSQPPAVRFARKSRFEYRLLVFVPNALAIVEEEIPLLIRRPG